jgi:hypothetical protein
MAQTLPVSLSGWEAVILEVIIAGTEIKIDGLLIPSDAVYAVLPIPLLREHRMSDAVGEVYQLQRRGTDLIAFCETDDADGYTHVSPALRVLSHDRMKLIEVSLVQQSKSPHTIILNRRPTDPLRAWHRSQITMLQTASERINNLRGMLHADGS